MHSKTRSFKIHHLAIYKSKVDQEKQAIFKIQFELNRITTLDLPVNFTIQLFHSYSIVINHCLNQYCTIITEI